MERTLLARGASDRMDLVRGDTRTSKVYSVANGGHNDYSGTKWIARSRTAQPVWTEFLRRRRTLSARTVRLLRRRQANITTHLLRCYVQRVRRFASCCLAVPGRAAAADGSTQRVPINWSEQLQRSGNASGSIGGFRHNGNRSCRCHPFTGDIYLNVNQKYGRWNRSSNTLLSDLSPTGQPSSGAIR